MPTPGSPSASSLIVLWVELVVFFVSAAATLVFTTPAIVWKIVRSPFSRRETRQFTGVLITGASGGIGRGLAKCYAAPGVHLTLVARRQAALEEAKAECERLGATVAVSVCDVSDEDQMRRIVAEADQRHPLDLVVANAGVIADREGFSGSKRVIDINVQGALNTVLPAVPRMRDRRRGQIVFMSSLGSFAPPTNAYMMPYLASKAAINQFAGGMRAALSTHNVGVSVVTVGYVESEMTMDDLKHRGVDMPGLVSTADACNRIRVGAEANDPVIFFPFWLYLITRVLGLLPGTVRDMILPNLIANDPFTKVDQQYAK